MSEKNKEIVKKVDASFSEGNVEGFLETCAEDIVWRIVGDRTTTGKEAIREWMSEMEGNEPPKINAKNHVAENDTVVAYGDMTMNEKGETVAYDYCDTYRFENGKIIELTSYVIKTEK